MTPHWTLETIIVYCFITTYLYFSLSRFSIRKQSLREKSILGRNIKIFFLSLIPTFFAVFRYISYPVGGTDATWYINAFMNVQFQPLKGWTLFADMDILFNNIMYLIHQISSNYHFFFLVIYLFMIATVYFFVYEMFDDVICFAPLIYLIYYYLQMYNILRFMLGLSILVVAYILISKNKKSVGLIFSIFAVMIHSALVLGAVAIIIYIILKRFAEKKGWILTGIAIAYVLFFVFQSKIVLYFNSTSYRGYTERGQSLLGQMMPIICIILCAVFYKPLTEEYKANKFMLYLVFFEAACIPIAMNLGYSRLHTIFLLPRLYLWGILIGIIRDRVKQKRFIWLTSYIIAIMWTVFRFSRDWYTAGWMPYILQIFRN